jgi:Polyketide cyclase / dehydrase and lipid transport
LALMEELTLTDTIEIKTTPEKIFAFLNSLVDTESYVAWHPQDHVSMRWLKGEPWQEGSVAYAEEYLHGKLHKLKFVVTKVEPYRRIDYAPASRFLRRYFPGNSFIIEPKEDTCLFKASGTLRIGWLFRTLARKHFESGLAGVKKHMKEEGENLKRILETE